MFIRSLTGRSALLAALLCVAACGDSAPADTGGADAGPLADVGPIGMDTSPELDVQDPDLDGELADAGSDITVITKDAGDDGLVADVPTLVDATQLDASADGGGDAVGPEDVAADSGGPDGGGLHQSVFGVTSGGGQVGSTNYGCRLIIGGPMGGATTSTNFRAMLGVGTLSNQ